MGMLALRDKDRTRAADRRDWLAADWTAFKGDRERLNHMISWCAKHKVRLIEKRQTKKKWSRFSTAFRNYILLRAGFWLESLQEQVRKLAHEIQHVITIIRIGRAKWASRYGFSHRQRWSWEAAAYAEGAAIMAAQGRGVSQIRAYADQKARALYKSHRLWSLRRAHVEKYTRVAILAASGI